MNWLPIETAPKDGTMILGYEAEGIAPCEEANWPNDNVRVLPMRWWGGADGDNWQVPYCVYEGPMYDDIGPSWYRPDWKPTHWAPITLPNTSTEVRPSDD